MNRRVALALSLVVAVALAGAAMAMSGDGDSPAAPTEAQARAALETKFTQAQTRDPEAYCADTEIVAMCQSQWQQLGGSKAVPTEPPRVVSSRVQDGFRVLRICGTDGIGEPYRTDFVVGTGEDGVTYELPVFWTGATFSGVHGDDTGRVDTATEPTAQGCE